MRVAREAKGNFDYLAGGTDLLPNYKCGINTHRKVIALRGIEELHGRTAASSARASTLGDLERDEEFLADYPAFAGALRTLASPLLRQSGTDRRQPAASTRAASSSTRPSSRAPR